MTYDPTHALDLAYVQKDPRTGEFISATAFNFWDGCRLLGIRTEFFDAARLDDLPLTPRTLVHGGVGVVIRALERLGVPAPHVDGAPPAIRQLFGRRIWE